jgi:hypothetical protein
MAFPSSNGSRRSLSIAYNSAKTTAWQAKQRTADVRAKAALGQLQRFDALRYLTECTDALASLATAGAQPGIADYAQAQENDPTLDIAAEFTGMVNAITAARDWIATNFPKSANGFVEVYQIDGTKRFADPSFTAATLTNLLPLLDAITASID